MIGVMIFSEPESVVLLPVFASSGSSDEQFIFTWVVSLVISIAILLNERGIHRHRTKAPIKPHARDSSQLPRAFL